MLAASQMSVHFAMQFFWIVYASLQEHCPKNAGSKRAIYKRHAAATATATARATATATATATSHTRTGASRRRQRSALPGHPLQPWA